MDSYFEPPIKRPKTMESDKNSSPANKIFEFIDGVIDKINSSKANLTPIIGDNFTKSIPYTEVWIAVIRNPKDTSKAVSVLNQKCPLKELQHLKRVRKERIIVVTSEAMTSENIEDYVCEYLDVLADIFEEYMVVSVPALQPKLKRQFEECNKIWPCNFHPNKHYELLLSGSYFGETELSVHRMFMALAYEVFKIKCAELGEESTNLIDMLTEYGATVVVDPTIMSVVAATFDKRQRHPIQHSAMLAIEDVARTQSGGCWESDDLNVKLKAKFPDLKFGAREFVSKSEGEDNDAKGPYLCTGYDVYTLKEPCVMCAMGLVHARARRVFFCYQNGVDGALMSKAKLQTIASLNHRFDVFTGFL